MNNISELFGYIGGFFLTINAVPEVIRTVKDKRCHIGWPMLLLWFLGEIFMTIYSVDMMSIPLMMNYIFNFVIVTIFLGYKIRHYYRRKLQLTTETRILQGFTRTTNDQNTPATPAV